MAMKTNLSQVIEASNDVDATYDANIKELFADKQILARILKYTLNEFMDMSIDDIIGSIGDDIEVSTRPLDPGLSNLGSVNRTATEDNVIGEGFIFYDIRFTAYIKGSEIKILINVEAQKSSNPSKLRYHIENRIIFYLARMISAQKQTEFFNSDYDSIKPVRSIWICMDSGETEDSIQEICLSENALYGNKGKTFNLDIMKGIVVNIRDGYNFNKSQNTLIAMLEELISNKKATEKKRILSEEYGMVMTVELEERINTMCNWSEAIAERELNRGINKERRDTIERMIKANIAQEQMISMGYSVEEISKVKDSLLAPV